MNGFREKLQQFMRGRNGIDSLGRFCLYTSLLLILISWLLFKFPAAAGIVNTTGFVMLIYSYFRALSRNVSKRYAENRRFLRWTSTMSRIAGDKTHKYYRCPQCRQTIRVPKGKGRIQITCPKCRSTFIKKT